MADTMTDPDVFSKELNSLHDLFKDLTDEDILNLREIFDTTEKAWADNVKRFSNKVVKYLLICEAPPSTGEYFYLNQNRPLFWTVWGTLFTDEKCSDPELGYNLLAQKGFLLIDTLPYSMNYSANRLIRKSDDYKKLITNCLPWWIQKLEHNFTLADPTVLKIAFGFKLNSEVVIEALNNNLVLSSHKKTSNYYIDESNLVAEKSTKWQPSKKRLREVFGF